MAEKEMSPKFRFIWLTSIYSWILGTWPVLITIVSSELALRIEMGEVAHAATSMVIAIVITLALYTIGLLPAILKVSNGLSLFVIWSTIVPIFLYWYIFYRFPTADRMLVSMIFLFYLISPLAAWSSMKSTKEKS